MYHKFQFILKIIFIIFNEQYIISVKFELYIGEIYLDHNNN
jgi:hypothetical protein